MLFNSIEYFLFLPTVFIVYWLLREKLSLQNLLLLLASYLFYGLWDFRFLTLIVLSSFTDFFIGLAIHKTENKKKRKLLLGFSLCINLGLLFVFKYCNFFIESFIKFFEIFDVSVNIHTLSIILPVGISFYTFQTLSYTIDIYRRDLIPTSKLLNFFTYVAFFPQLVAGPIERAVNLLPQIENKRTFSYEQGRDGLRQILWGLFKKVAVADNCAAIVDPIFSNYAELGSLDLILGAILFSFQIYCDFSGYSDIAIGTAKLLGIKLMQNFATPYFSRDISEFWRRWHISLSTWFRDYLYIPLGGSRVSRIKQLRNIFAIFLVSGFWHGANWTFLFWGGLHAFLYIPLILFDKNRKYLEIVAVNNYFPSLRELFNILKTFIITSIAWIFFRSDTISDSFGYIKNIFYSANPVFSLEYIEEYSDLYLTLLVLCILIIFEWINRAEEHGFALLPKLIILRYVIYFCFGLMVIEFLNGEKPFIYFQF